MSMPKKVFESLQAGDIIEFTGLKTGLQRQVKVLDINIFEETVHYEYLYEDEKGKTSNTNLYRNMPYTRIIPMPILKTLGYPNDKK